MTPWITPVEAHNIAKVTNIDFYTPPIGASSFGRLKRKENLGCIFLSSLGCDVLDIRPFDCRMFPFALFVREDKYYLIRWKISCPEHINWEDDCDIALSLARTRIKDYVFDDTMVTPNMYVLMKDITEVVYEELAKC